MTSAANAATASSPSSLPINFIPDSFIMFFASTITTLFLIYRTKIIQLQNLNKKKLLLPKPTGPYQPPPANELHRQLTTPAPSVEVLEKAITREEDQHLLHGEPLPGYTLEQIRIHRIDSLRDHFPSRNISNLTHQRVSSVTGAPISYNCVLSEEDFILGDIVRKTSDAKQAEAFVRAGPRTVTHFDPRTVNAAIVTCGGLCPGLNNVIRELVHALVKLYNVNKVYGIRGGFNGMTTTGAGACDPSSSSTSTSSSSPSPHTSAASSTGVCFPGNYSLIELTEDLVADCHHQGGSILGSSRGGFDLDRMILFLQHYNITQLYVIGGDGTHRAAQTLALECLQRKLNISVAGIPKTIDNDVDLIDRSFGFQTSVEAAQAAIQSAKTEARCNLPNGVGIVKLMGRSAGFIAVHATLGSGDIDLCLVPEIPIVLEGEDGYLPFLLRRVLEKGHAVVVVAEGAGEELLGQSAEIDAGGNRKLPPIGEFMKEKIEKFFQENGYPSTVKYINPSYMIR
jgi:6-phosphofructokinase 1